jgi:hypothetical protein
MNINLQIDRLVLNGINLTPSQQIRLQAAVEAELAYLFTINGLPPHLQNGGAIPNVLAEINLGDRMNPTQMGQHIAQSVYQTMLQPSSSQRRD